MLMSKTLLSERRSAASPFDLPVRKIHLGRFYLKYIFLICGPGYPIPPHKKLRNIQKTEDSTKVHIGKTLNFTINKYLLGLVAKIIFYIFACVIKFLLLRHRITFITFVLYYVTELPNTNNVRDPKKLLQIAETLFFL